MALFPLILLTSGRGGSGKKEATNQAMKEVSVFTIFPERLWESANLEERRSQVQKE